VARLFIWTGIFWPEKKGVSMPARTSEHPTEAELEILNILWRRGPSTVRQVHEILQADRATRMTTTLKILQMMTEKGLTRRSDSRPQLYTAARAEAQTQSGLLNDLARKAFAGSVQKLTMRAVEEGGMTAEELKEIEKLINAHRKEKRGDK
jgi:predicted transcriptional regulator